MDVKEAVYKRRSVRSFTQQEVPQEVLAELVDAARVGPAAANRQPLEYVAVTDPQLREEIFACLKWAAYIAPRGNPQPGHHPTAYLVVLRRKDYELEGMSLYDVGAAVQTILLMAVAKGLGACWLKSVNYPRVAKLLGVPEGVEVDSVIALGYPDEEPRLVNLEPDQEGLEVIKYWRDKQGQHYVPKRALAAVLHRERYGNRG
jgi:nitroreductase